MQTIKRDIYVTKNVLQAPIEVTEGTNSIALEFDIKDYTIHKLSEESLQVIM